MSGLDCDSVRMPPFFGVKGSLYRACVEGNARQGEDEHGNPKPGVQPTPPSGGGSILGIPLPSSDWLRHMMFRAGEVIVGIAMIIVGVKAFTNSGDTIKVITSGAKKVAKKV